MVFSCVLFPLYSVIFSVNIQKFLNFSVTPQTLLPLALHYHCCLIGHCALKLGGYIVTSGVGVHLTLSDWLQMQLEVDKRGRQKIAYKNMTQHSLYLHYLLSIDAKATRLNRNEIDETEMKSYL